MLREYENAECESLDIQESVDRIREELLGIPTPASASPNPHGPILKSESRLDKIAKNREAQNPDQSRVHNHCARSVH